jgi:RNA polymerase sigma factor (TIGR02999 family)
MMGPKKPEKDTKPGMETDDQHVARTLNAAVDGDREASSELLPRVYDQLRALARERLRLLPPGQTLQPTALVHEAYLRVSGSRERGWDGQRHFFGAAARAMRQILVEAARRKAADKRGGGKRRVSLDSADVELFSSTDDVLVIDEVMQRLERLDERKGQILNLRYFAQLSTEDTAGALGISPATVRREWRFIVAWLERELRDEG